VVQNSVTAVIVSYFIYGRSLSRMRFAKYPHPVSAV
jgi:hypothetical protein